MWVPDRMKMFGGNVSLVHRLGAINECRKSVNVFASQTLPTLNQPQASSAFTSNSSHRAPAAIPFSPLASARLRILGWRATTWETPSAPCIIARGGALV